MPHRSMLAWIAAALLFALAVPSPTRAAAGDGQFRVKGVGGETCREFAQAYAARTPPLILFGGWLEGYVSAINRHREKTFDAIPWQSTEVLLALINNHCAGNPEQRFFAVVHAMLGFFEAQTLREPSQPVEIVAGEHKVQVYKEILRRAQEALTLAGTYEGVADGVYGPKTRAAFEAYQAAKNLPQTGVPDQRTLVALFAGPPAN